MDSHDLLVLSMCFSSNLLSVGPLRTKPGTPYSMLPAEAWFANILGMLILIFSLLVLWALARPAWKRPEENTEGFREVSNLASSSFTFGQFEWKYNFIWVLCMLKGEGFLYCKNYGVSLYCDITLMHPQFSKAAGHASWEILGAVCQKGNFQAQCAVQGIKQ